MQQGAPGMERMAAMGGSGKHPQNLYRAMKHLLGWPKGAAPVSFIEIPTVRGAKTPPIQFSGLMIRYQNCSNIGAISLMSGYAVQLARL